MNKDSQSIFEAYLKTSKPKQVVVTEAPVYGDEASFDSGAIARRGKPVAGGKELPYGYVMGQDEAGTTDVVNRVLDIVKTRVFSREPKNIEGKNFDLYYAGTPEDFKVAVGNAIIEVLGLDPAKKHTSARDYAARVFISDVLKAKKVPGADGIVANAPAVNPAAAANVEQAIDAVKKEEGVVEVDKPNVAAPVEPKEAPVFNLIKKYTIDRDRYSEKLEEEIKDAYNVLIRNGMGIDKHTGSNIVNALRAVYSYTRSKQLAAALTNAGILVLDEDEGDKDVPALDAPEDDLEAAIRKEYKDLERQLAGGKTNPFIPD